MKKTRDSFSLVLLLVCLAFYCFFALFDGAVICVDSPGYISMSSSREPLYVLLLLVFRSLFTFAPEAFYLETVVWFQSVLAALATYCIAQYLRKEFHLSRLFTAIVAVIPLAVSLLCRFAAKRSSMYSNSILTEGIAISLYLLFFRYILDYFLNHKRGSLLFSCLFSALLISTRKQMLISLCLILVAVLCNYIHEKHLFKGVLVAVAVSIGILGSTTALDMGYNYFLRGEMATHSSDVRFITTVAFYVAAREDADSIQDSEIRELFLRIYDDCDSSGYLKHSAGKGWSNRVSHFGDYYDCIQIDTMWPQINQYVQEKYGYESFELNLKADEIMSDINYAVLPHHIGATIEVFLDNFRSGLVTTVAQRNRLLNIYSIFAYLAYLILAVLNRKKTKVCKLSVLVLLSVIFNVGLCSLVIFCQTRYMIYNMSLFYIGLVVMIWNLFHVFFGKSSER